MGIPTIFFSINTVFELKQSLLNIILHNFFLNISSKYLLIKKTCFTYRQILEKNLTNGGICLHPFLSTCLSTTI